MKQLFLAIALAGCSLIKTSSSTTTPGSSGSSGSPDTETWQHKGIIVRDQLATLTGLTPDQAKQELKRLGHDGTVSVAVARNNGGGETFVESCGENKVCQTSGESGISVHDEIVLYINPQLKIDLPPP